MRHRLQSVLGKVKPEAACRTMRENAMRNLLGYMSVVVCMGALLASLRAAAQEVFARDIGVRLELLVDHYMIDRLDGTSLVLHEPQAANVAILFDRPWEGRYCAYVTVLKDGDRYRMYYRGLPTAGADGSEVEATCYAESADGITFTKPNLGLFEVMGTHDNNAVLAHMAPFHHNFSPFIDTRPGVPAEERYKAVAGTRSTGLVAFVSPDGIRWKKLREEPLITEGAFDSQNLVFWSESEDCYCCYLRTFVDGYRWIARTTSKDFLNWTPPVNMSFGDAPKEHLYTNQTQPYFRAPHLYVATAARFMPERRVVAPEQFAAVGGEERYSGDCSDAVLLTSRGSDRYDRTFMEGFVRPGIGLSHWTSRTNYPACGVVQTGPYEMSLYIQRNYGQPSAYLQRFTLRLDGFASVRAPYAGGAMTTRPFTFSGKELLLNVSTSAAGSVWVEILDADGQPVPGYTREDADEIIGDEIERIVTWKGNRDVSALTGKPVRLRFIMKDADLYALRFRP